MRFINKRILIITGCLISAALISFVALPALYQARSNTIEVLRAAKDIGSGTKINAEDLEAVVVGAYNLPQGIAVNKADVIGKYAATDITKDDYFTPGKITASGHGVVLSSGQRIITISLSGQAAGLANHLKKGDKVTVAVYYSASQEATIDGVVNVAAKTVILPELKNIEVYSIENSKGAVIEDINDDGDIIPKTATLIVTEEQAVRLIEPEYAGKIHLILEKRGGGN